MDIVFIVDLPLPYPGDAIGSYWIQSGDWICSLSQEEAVAHLLVSVSYQPTAETSQRDTLGYIAHYNRLQIHSGNVHHVDSFVLEVPVRQPEALLCGMQVEVDPSMLDFQKSIVFRIILLTGLQDGSDLTFTTQPRSVALSNQRRRRSSCRPSCRPSCNVLEWPMFMDPQQRVKEMLEHPTNADTYLSFCYKQHPYRSGHPRLSDKSQDEYVLQTHSCILKIIQTGPMNRLLNTFVSDDENPCRHQSPDTAAVGHNEDTVGQDGMVSTCLEPIRDIRFEDVPPAAVEAVIRYIYLGSVPVLEPLCGYTVKDLMALATYLDIEVLKDVCVDMVLGRSRCEYDYGANHSVGGDRRSPTAATLWERPCYHPYRVDKKKSCTTSRHHLQTKCRVRLGSVVQVLFGWGFRFPKMRAALIRALVQEQGRRTTYGGDKHSTATDPIPAIDRFHGHEAYAQILCEMVAEQLRARGTS